MIRVEVLFPGVCNLFGDTANMKYLQEALGDKGEMIYTTFLETPAFVTEDVDMIYMGSMSEDRQEKVITKLMPYRNRLQALMEKGTVFLTTGNAMEVFGYWIIKDDGSKIKGLGLYQMSAKRDMYHRYNSICVGTYEDGETSIEIVGFKAQFTTAKIGPEVTPFMQVERGYGLTKTSTIEGVHLNNFFGVYLLGPFLVLNPLFTKYLLNLLGLKKVTLPYESVVMEAYQNRLIEFKDPKRGIS